MDQAVGTLAFALILITGLLLLHTSIQSGQIKTQLETQERLMLLLGDCQCSEAAKRQLLPQTKGAARRCVDRVLARLFRRRVPSS